MHIRRIITQGLALVCLALLLAGCGGISQSEAIKIAKQAAGKLSSPPHVYREYVYSPAYSDTADLRLWPDELGSNHSQYNVCGAEPVEPEMKATCTHPITLTTSLTTNSGQDVTFIISWPATRLLEHSWLFHVSDDGKADFIKEEGDKLPQMPR
jgi:hypothetical protein